MTTPAVVPEPPVVPLRQKLGQLAAAVVIAAVLAWAWRGAELRPLELFTERGNMLSYLSGFLRPDFLDWRTYLAEMVVTLEPPKRNIPGIWKGLYKDDRPGVQTRAAFWMPCMTLLEVTLPMGLMVLARSPSR